MLLTFAAIIGGCTLIVVGGVWGDIGAVGVNDGGNVCTGAGLETCMTGGLSFRATGIGGLSFRTTGGIGGLSLRITGGGSGLSFRTTGIGGLSFRTIGGGSMSRPEISLVAMLPHISDADTRIGALKSLCESRNAGPCPC